MKLFRVYYTAGGIGVLSIIKEFMGTKIASFWLFCLYVHALGDNLVV